MKRFLYVILGVLFFIEITAQTPTASLNSVSTYSPRIATSNTADLNNTNNAAIQVHYMDGRGQALQAVHYKASPSQKDVVSGFHTLDALGRPKQAYLTVPTTQSFGAFQSTVPSLATSFYGDNNPYSEVTQYQSSPQSVPLESVGVGESFRGSTNKTTSQSYQTAGAGIRKYIYRSNTEADVNGFFVNGDLIKSSSVDEDGNEIIKYKDGVSGRLYESHQKDKGNSNVLITTYIYDQLGRPKYVLPPKATTAALANIGTGKLFNQTDLLFQEGVYAVNYNDWGLEAETHQPGGGWNYVVYNELESPVLSQDERHKLTNLWLWAKKDGHGRTVLSGTFSNSNTRASLQNSFFNNGATQQFEERSSSGGNLYGYTNTSFPSGLNPSSSDVQAVYYYDDYTWVSNSSLNFSFYKTAQWANAKGLATGSLVKRLDTGAFLKSVSYYDDKNRVIQTKTENRFGGINQTDLVYNFPGEVLEERTIYRKPGQADIEVKTIYERDHRGRVLGAVHYLDGKPTPLAQYKYDEIGRLTQKNLMAAAYDIITEDDDQPNGDQDLANRYVLLEPGTISAANGTYLACVIPEALQQIDYTYDIRGALRGINTDAAGNINLQNGDVFGMKLDHHETGQTYNGKIAKQTWQTVKNATVENRSYTYGYDGYDRLSGANFSGVGAENYSVTPIQYDANGNINALQRNGFNGSTWGQIDNLNYQYANSSFGNRLNYVQDYANTSVGFKDNGGSSIDYTYYPDESLKSDANKGITLIEYNFLGQQEKVHFGATVRIENTYDAEGLLLYRKVVNGSSTSQKDFMGGLIYEDDILKSIDHNEGIVKIENGDISSPRYQFFMTDHLGSTRVIIERLNGNTALVQEVHYGPWGEVLEGVGVTGDWKFLFQGKEYVSDFGANLYDFHTRSYDPYTGRFNQIDGANQFASGYTGMGNSPVSMVDPDGQIAWFVPIIIGAAIGGTFNGVKYDKQGKGFFNGFWKGSITGAVGGALSLVGTPATLGGNILWGAGEGAFTGGLDAVINGESIGRGVLYGAGTGAVFGFFSSQQLKNTLKGQGFRNNDAVLKSFVANEDYQGALDYFGFEGKYSPNKPGGAEHVESSDYWGATSPSSGDISFGNSAFTSYDNLYATSVKENFHRNRILAGIGPESQKPFLDFKVYAPEESLGFIHGFRNQGLFPKTIINFLNQIEFYQLQTYGLNQSDWFKTSLFQNVLFKTPRRWNFLLK